MLRLSALASASLIVVLGAFTLRLSGTPELPDTPYNYANIALPGYLNVPPIRGEDNTPNDNPITDAGATLGRVLFYDTRLSSNETISCSSCHLQEMGFSDPEALSTGFDGGKTGRNSMGLAFARYYDSGHFFWDERAATLEDQVLMPIQDPVEMGMTLDNVIARLEATTFYPDLFEDAFGTPEITSDRMSQAMAQFVRSIVSPNSKYDIARQQAGGPPGQRLAGLTDQENDGLELFFGRGRCAQCHRGDLFVGDEARNNGLDATLTDEGAGDGRFKTGSLRNIALTAPYMHDGRFSTLAEVIDHYSTGIRGSASLDQRLRDPQGRPIQMRFNLTEHEALLAFLNTLTDETLATDVRWSNPFPSPPLANEAGTPSTAPQLELSGPNPVRSQTAFRIELAAPADVTLEIYDRIGRHVATVLEGPVSGERVVQWTPDGLDAGLYIARLRAGGSVATEVVTVVR
ncbi:MAG: cytochrome c peroxidase [Bacteroidota bacterium]